MLARGARVSAGTDATRVASYNPWVSLSWLVTGRTVGGTTLYPPRNRLDRETALRLWTEANTWFSNEQGKKGAIKAGQLANLTINATLGAVDLVSTTSYLSLTSNENEDSAATQHVLMGIEGPVVAF